MNKIFMICLVFLSTTGLFAGTIRVGNDANLQAAFDKAKDGDTIIIVEGLYETSDTLTIKGKNHIKIIGEGIVDFICQSYIKVISLENCEMISIENIHMVHKYAATSDSCGVDADLIYLYKCDKIRVINCELNGCGTIGVHCYNTSRVEIKGCYIHSNTQAGIKIVMSKGRPEKVIIKNNRIINNYKPLVYVGNVVYEDTDDAKELILSGNTFYPRAEINW